MWSTSRQSFPTQSTPESGPVGLCGALVGGRATVGLAMSARDEKEDLRKRLWGETLLRSVWPQEKVTRKLAHKTFENPGFNLACGSSSRRMAIRPSQWQRVSC